MPESLKSTFAFCSKIALPIILYNLATQKIVHANSACEELSGRTTQDITNCDLLTFFINEQRSRISSLLLLTGTQPPGLFFRENDLELIRQSGRRSAVNVICSKLVIDGVDHILLHLEDLTFIKKILNERQKLAEESVQLSKLAEIGQISACLAHEINNPLAIAKGHLEELEHKISTLETRPEELQSHLEPILRSVERISTTVKILLNQARPHEITMASFNLKKIIDPLVDSLSQKFKATAVNVKTLIEAELRIACDHYYFDQILQNILINAHQAVEGMKSSGRIEVRAKLNQTHLTVEVWNNGPPITEQNSAKIFTPHFTTKKEQLGNGLGLYMARNMMRSMGGELGFKSTATDGTTFYMEFKK